MRLLLLIVVSLSAWAGQSLDLTPGVTGSYTVPAASPFTAMSDFRLEFRLHGFTACSGNYKNIWAFGPKLALRCAADGDTDLYLSDYDASVSVVIPMSGRTDVLVRVQRTAGVLYGEVWNTSTGGGYVLRTRDNATATAQNLSGASPIGSDATTIRLAWIHWFSTTVDLGSSAPRAAAVPNVASWGLDGNGLDSVGAMTATISGASYVSSPLYDPIADVRPAVAQVSTYPTIAVARVGAALQLSGAGSLATTDDEVLSYLWERKSGPVVTISNATIASPSITVATPGELVMRLTVTDSADQSAYLDYTLGAVAADSSGVVTHSDARVEQVFGRLVKWGSSPWPYLDDRHMALADHFGEMLADSTRADDWNTALAGTITVTNGSATVTGSGTDFQVDFCSGGTSGGNTELVVWYPVGDGTYGRRAYGVSSCASATSITLSSAYAATTTTAGLNYAKLSCPGCWYGGSNNFNYYDNVLAFYSLYYRTGLTKYRTYARTLADRWWTNPYIDQGRIAWFGSDFAPRLPSPRVLAVTGLLWRAYEGEVSAMWPGLRLMIDVEAPTRTDIWDMREQAYQTAFVAVAALLDPDTEEAAAWADVTDTAVADVWLANQDELGGWRGITYGYQSANTTPTSYATVTNGSTTVSGVDTASYWPASLSATGYYGLWARFGDDTTAYWVTAWSPTSATITPAYAGASGTKTYQINTFVGTGTQPFMLGVIGTALSYAYTATGSTSARQMVLDVAAWEAVYGYRTETRGLYQGRVFPGCEPPVDAANMCSYAASTATGSKSWDRYMNGEVIGAVARAYRLSGTTAIKTTGENLAGAAFGKLGGVSTDAYYAVELDETIIYDKAKNFGFFFGFGGAGAAWFGVESPGPRLSGGSFTGGIFR